jgi:predicted dehydrogenase
MNNTVNIAIIGGSGFWSEQSHHKHLKQLQSQFPLKLSAIVDLVDPNTVSVHENLQATLTNNDVAWINPINFKNTDDIVAALKEQYKINLVIIASNPSTHFDYGMSCIKYGLNTLCDKPIVTTNNASTDPFAAAQIAQQFNDLLNAYQSAKKQNPSLLFHSILRRRSLEPFVQVADELKTVHDRTGAGINNMTILVNGGIYKFPAEFTAPGAHGYLDGVGSLAHSAYHYIDVFAWFLSRAPGSATKIRPQLNYVLRIKDYLEAESFQSIAEVIKTSKESLVIPELTNEVLGCELNTGFTFTLCSEDERPLGQVTFLFNHVSFTPRTNIYDENIHEPANRKGGGRVSHFMIDVNQEGLQSWQISKNDIVFEGNNISLQGRRHPLIEGESFVSHLYEDAYEPEISMKDLLAHTIEKVQSGNNVEGHSVIRSLEEERLAAEIYASCYELIAEQYKDPLKNHQGSYIKI